MSELLLSWLNDELKLSREINNLAQDFKNGYLLGEILMRYNFHPDYVLFRDSTSELCKFNNFRVLEPQLRSMGIDFNGMTAFSIMNGDANIVTNLLYRMREALGIYKGVHRKVNSEITNTFASSIPLHRSLVRTQNNSPDKYESEISTKRTLDTYSRSPERVSKSQRTLTYRSPSITKVIEGNDLPLLKSQRKALNTNIVKSLSDVRPKFHSPLKPRNRHLKADDWESDFTNWRKDQEEIKFKELQSIIPLQDKYLDHRGRHLDYYRDREVDDVHFTIQQFDKRIGKNQEPPDLLVYRKIRNSRDPTPTNTRRDWNLPTIARKFHNHGSAFRLE